MRADAPLTNHSLTRPPLGKDIGPVVQWQYLSAGTCGDTCHPVLWSEVNIEGMWFRTVPQGTRIKVSVAVAGRDTTRLQCRYLDYNELTA